MINRVLWDQSQAVIALSAVTLIPIKNRHRQTHTYACVYDIGKYDAHLIRKWVFAPITNTAWCFREIKDYKRPNHGQCIIHINE